MVAIFILISLIEGIYAHGYIHPQDYRDHPCIRPCEINKHMTCQYHFTLQYYNTMSKACYDCPFNKTDCSRPHCVAADGFIRPIMTVNRMLPGPSIQVCLNDTVVVDVANKLEGAEGTSIHWHGIHVPPYMDGVGMLTQCPIPSASTFQYRFEAVTPGTHYWHSHSGLQNADGIFGTFVIREPPELDAHNDLYDIDTPEFTVIINDWMKLLGVARLSDKNHRDNLGNLFPSLMLINGKGAYHEFTRDNISTYTPYEVFNVQPDRRYRFRIVSNGLNACPFLFSIDNHNLTVIASDGASVEQYTVNSLYMASGERYDVIINTNQTINNYWIRASGNLLCARYRVHQEAILRYNGASDMEPTEPRDWSLATGGKVLNPPVVSQSENMVYITELRSIYNNDEALKEFPDQTIYLSMDFYNKDNVNFHDPRYYGFNSVTYYSRIRTQQLNHISMMLPPAPAQSQYHDIPSDMFCNEDTVSVNCTREYCECIHVIKIPLGNVVELIMVDEGVPLNTVHPFHLHGNYFRVIAMDKLNTSTSLAEVKLHDHNRLLKRNLDRAPLKDSVIIPDGGYTIIRFHAERAGFWFFHCHQIFHLQIGQAVILQVGEPEEQPKLPKNFPKCGPWKFEGFESDNTGNCETSTIGPTGTGVKTISSGIFITLCACYSIFI